MKTVALILFGVTAVIVSSSGFGTAAPVPKHLMGKEAESGDKTKLQGKWKLESMKMGGKDALPAGINIDMLLEIKDDQFSMKMNVAGMDMTGTATMTYSTDGKREFKTTNMRISGPDGKQIDSPQKEQSMGFAFDGDKLLIGSTNGPDGKAVDPLKPGPNDMVMTLTRVKDK